MSNNDPGRTLEDLARRASRYKSGLVLNDQIIKDNKTAFRGGFAYVYLGYMRRKGTKVAIKTLRNGPTGDVDIMKVR